MFLVIFQWYYWCLVQMCLILDCKFVYAAARVLSYFFSVILVFSLSVFVCKFSTALERCQAIFVFYVLAHQTSSLLDHDNFGTNCFAFYFSMSNLSSYFWCLIQTYLIFKVQLVYLGTKINIFFG